jgi:hypothetical protein
MSVLTPRKVLEAFLEPVVRNWVHAFSGRFPLWPARAAPRVWIRLLLVCCFSVCLQACAGDRGEAEEEEDTYAAVQALFSEAGCGSFGCHGSGAIAVESKAWVEWRVGMPPLGRLAEWSVGRETLLCAAAGQSPMKRVVPGSPETSYLVHALRGTHLCGGVRMPSGGPYLDEQQIQLVEKWIRDLAK